MAAAAPGARQAPAPAGAGAPVPQSPLDVGPSTILGERPNLIDPVVQALVRALEAHAADFGAAGGAETEVEVEARLGIVARPRGDKADESRVDLPCSTEVLLTRGLKGFEYRFLPGLATEVFVDLSTCLDKLCGEEPGPERRGECLKSFEHTVDVLYVNSRANSEAAIRVSYFLDANGQKDVTQPPRASVKKKLEMLDLYSGRRPGEQGPAVDVRLAVSAEVDVPGFEPGPDLVEHLRRNKMRKSFHFKAWRIDVSQVTTSYPSGSETGEGARHTQSYEVELELDSHILRRNLDAKLAGERHRLWELLSDFLFAARDLAALAGLIGPLELPPAPAPPAEGIPNEAERAAFLQKHGEVEPVVGHYLYRLALPRAEPLPWPPPSLRGKRGAEEEAAGRAAKRPSLPPPRPPPQGFGNQGIEPSPL